MKNEVKVYLTAMATDFRIAQMDSVPLTKDTKGVEKPLICLYEDAEYQTMIGFGGAFTEAAAETYYKLPEKVRKEIAAAYFDSEKGNGYTFCRTHMNSCDFSLGNYACAEKPGDIELESFNINREKKAIIPMMKEASEYGDFQLLISPWSPPAWMKDTGKMNYGGKLLPEYKDAWARYYAKFIQAYRKEGLNIWGTTVQNEPKAVQIWDSCIYTAEEEKDFVKEHLGPVMQKEGLGDVKILIWDHNKERLYQHSKAAYEDAAASRYISGSAFHWYSGDHFGALDAVHKRWPEKQLVFTEGATIMRLGIGAWENAEVYSHDMIGNLNNYAAAWCEWNMLLDEEGGPNHVGNFSEAPIIGDTRSGKIEYKPSYYYIGHFSRFIRPGSKRIGCSIFTEDLECTAFKNQNGEIAVVVLNRNDKAVDFSLYLNEQLAAFESLPHSIMTLVI